MANIVIEFTGETGQRVSRFTLRNQSDSLAQWVAGDEIGFDLPESNDFFFATVSRKVYLVGYADPLHIICVPYSFKSLEEAARMMEKFRLQFGEDFAS